MKSKHEKAAVRLEKRTQIQGVGAYTLREGEGHEPNDSVLSGFSRA